MEIKPLGPKDLHVWRTPLASSIAAVEALRALLSQDERERAGRFAFEKDAARYICCRATLRLVLSRYVGAPPERLVFRYEAHGKPALADFRGWQFNVSHSRDLATIAVSRGEAVGVDVEFIDPDFPCRDVAPDVFTPEELRDLAALPEAERNLYFCRLWTAKEALLKAVGTGFSVDPRELSVRIEPGPAILAAPAEFAGASLHCVDFGSAWAAAVAVLGDISEVGIFGL